MPSVSHSELGCNSLGAGRLEACVIIDEILGVARELFGLRDLLSKTRADRRAKVVAFFESVSRCVADVSTSIKNDQVPHGKCAEMEIYAQELPALVEDEVGKDRARALGEKLRAAYEVERLLGELPGGPVRDQELAKLDQAAGVFQALANVVRAS